MAAQSGIYWRGALYSAIGHEVNKRRVEAKLSLRDVAEKMGYTFQAVQRVEEGEGAPVHFLAAFAQLVGCTMNDLVPTVKFHFARKIEKSGSDD